MEYLVYSQGMQLQAITGWSSFPLIPKTMDHFWKYRLHLYSHIPPWANTCMHSFIHVTAQQRREHFSIQCTKRTHTNAIWDVQRSAEQHYVAGHSLCTTYKKEASLFETTQRALALHSQHQELMFWTLEVPVSHLRWQALHAYTVSWFSAGLSSQVEARLTSLWKRHPSHLMNCVQETNLQ